jgi:hypothetical protein
VLRPPAQAAETNNPPGHDQNPGVKTARDSAGHRLERETDSALRRGMHYPSSWDPFFASYMTLYDLYQYPARHFGFHQRQLTLHNPD